MFRKTAIYVMLIGSCLFSIRLLMAAFFSGELVAPMALVPEQKTSQFTSASSADLKPSIEKPAQKTLPVVKTAQSSQTAQSLKTETSVPVVPRLDQQAIASFQQSLNQAPDYLPPLSEPVEFEEASAEEIADHEAYVEREISAERQLKRSFVKAATNKVKKIDELIELGQQKGVADDLLEEARQKRAHLELLVKQYEQELVYSNE